MEPTKNKIDKMNIMSNGKANNPLRRIKQAQIGKEFFENQES
jgi:hypothetical protein